MKNATSSLTYASRARVKPVLSNHQKTIRVWTVIACVVAVAAFTAVFYFLNVHQFRQGR